MKNKELADKIYKLRTKIKNQNNKIDIGSKEYKDLKVTLGFYEQVLDNMGSINQEIVLIYHAPYFVEHLLYSSSHSFGRLVYQ